MPEDFWLVGLLGFGLAVCLLAAALHSRRKKHLIDDLPTSKVAGVFIGLVELKGTAESEAPLVSFLREERCVQFAWKVEEEWRKTETETYRDKDGKTQTRTKTSSGWRTVAQGGDLQPFYLRDDTGVILVHPRGAKLEGRTLFSQTCRRSDPLYYAKGPQRATADSTHRRRFVEDGIPLHAQLYLVGKARERKDVVAPEIAADPEAKLFLISTRSEQQVSAGLGWKSFWLNLFGMLTVAGSQFWIWREHPDAVGQALVHGWGWGAGYAACWLAGWLAMTYNSLVCVRQRMRRAWSTVEVELRRRSTLIPQLIPVLQALKSHEQSVQETVAHLRTQQGATEPGCAGPDPAGCLAPLRAVVEAYPQLKADQGFRDLQDQLRHTEERIALARSYFNEVCTHYNTRIEIVPDRWVAAMGQMKAHPLITARDFERAEVRVQLAD